MKLKDSDSLLDSIFYFLWVKKDICIKDDTNSVRIPNTIITLDNRILTWYFYSKREKTILLK